MSIPPALEPYTHWVFLGILVTIVAVAVLSSRAESRAIGELTAALTAALGGERVTGSWDACRISRGRWDLFVGFEIDDGVPRGLLIRAPYQNLRRFELTLSKGMLGSLFGGLATGLREIPEAKDRWGWDLRASHEQSARDLLGDSGVAAALHDARPVLRDCATVEHGDILSQSKHYDLSVSLVRHRKMDSQHAEAGMRLAVALLEALADLGTAAPVPGILPQPPPHGGSEPTP